MTSFELIVYELFISETHEMRQQRAVSLFKICSVSKQREQTYSPGVRFEACLKCDVTKTKPFLCQALNHIHVELYHSFEIFYAKYRSINSNEKEKLFKLRKNKKDFITKS